MDQKTAPYGALMLRVLLGVLFIAHASLKFFVFTPQGTEKFFASLGLPGWFGLFIMGLEAVAGMMLIGGVYARIVALIMIPDLLCAIYLVHWQNGFFFDNTNGGWEYPFVWAVALLVLALLGDGALALKRTPAHWSISGL